jgi:hypothetical protein
LIEAWASHKSFVRQDGGGPEKPAGRNPTVDFSGEKRSNATHESTTDAEARLYKKGEFTEAKLRYITHALSENRHGLIVDVATTQATGNAEVEAATVMSARSVPVGGSVAADKGYDRPDFISPLQARGIKPHVARKAKRSAVDGRTARGKGYALSLSRRKMIEEAFGWLKTVGGFRKTRHRGLAKVSGQGGILLRGLQPDALGEPADLPSRGAGGARLWGGVLRIRPEAGFGTLRAPKRGFRPPSGYQTDPGPRRFSLRRNG